MQLKYTLISRRFNGSITWSPLYQVDEQRHRVSLGMKNSYMGDSSDNELPSKQESDEAIRENGFSDNTQMVTFPGRNLLELQNLDIDGEDGECLVLAQAESRASIPALEVSLDDIDQTEMDNLNQEQIYEADTINEKNMRRSKKKDKEERLFQFLH